MTWSAVASAVVNTAGYVIGFSLLLPKQTNSMCVYYQEPVPSLNQLDSSSNPSSATSSTPSSPAHFQQSNPPSVSATPPPNPSPQGYQDDRFHFPGKHCASFMQTSCVT